MRKKVRSSYIIAKIFSYLNEKIKLKTIKYNKDLQKKIGINIINYKFFSGKKILYENNGEVKEYNCYSNKLIFKGEYSNGERNGQGKEL